jgi:hypothetical protein
MASNPWLHLHVSLFPDAVSLTKHTALGPQKLATEQLPEGSQLTMFAARVKPLSQLQVYPPTVLSQFCEQSSVDSAHSSISEHKSPFTVKPALQVHVNDPAVLEQVELFGQLPPLLHSFTSTHAPVLFFS